MSELQLIETTVAKAGWRRRWQRAWRGFWKGMLAGAVCWLIILGLYKVLPLPEIVLAGGAALTGMAALAGGAAGWGRKEELQLTARWLDQRQQLRERLSTALEGSRDERLGPWRPLLVNDAARHLAGMDLPRLLPYHLPRATHFALLVLALGAGLGFVPEYRSAAFLQRQREKEVIKTVGRNLADLTRRSLERRKPALEPTRETLKNVGELGDQLTRNPPTRPDALRDLARMSEKVQQEAKDLAKNPALRSLEKAAQKSGQDSPADAEELKRQMDAMEKALGNQAGQEDALDKLRAQLQKAMQAAAGLAGKDSKGGDAARDQLAQALSDLARQAQDLGAALPGIEEAIAALQAGKIDQVMKDLKVAEKDLEKLQQMAQALQKLQQQTAKLGKDLAEQLENGQGDAALATLKKMISQLKSSGLPAEQLGAILQEVSKAVPQAEPYGKVAEHLKQAVKEMQQGQKEPAAESLAKAAKELADLMQQMADAQDLKSTLDALKRAQMIVGSGGMGGTLLGLPRAGKGGKPGRGVGTWADETGWQDIPEETEAWDNSGIERPDMDPRGHTDRGDGELPDGLATTRVKGQLSPGGPMPSITLKGVSIKGASKVAIQEAITAAQSEAQSALTHEQVPRAYQGAVKDYFNDLNPKKASE